MPNSPRTVPRSTIPDAKERRPHHTHGARGGSCTSLTKPRGEELLRQTPVSAPDDWKGLGRGCASLSHQQHDTAARRPLRGPTRRSDRRVPTTCCSQSDTTNTSFLLLSLSSATSVCYRRTAAKDNLSMSPPCCKNLSTTHPYTVGYFPQGLKSNSIKDSPFNKQCWNK